MSAFWYALLTACLWGIVPVIEKVGLAKVDPGAGIFYRGFGVVIGMFFLLPFFFWGGMNLKADARSITILLCSGLLASFIGQFFFYRALKIGEASLIVPLAGTYPLVSFVIGVFLLHEQVTVGKIIGIILVISGIALLK